MALAMIWNSLHHQYGIILQPWITRYWPRVEPYYEVLKSLLFHGTIVFVVASFCLYISAFLFGMVYYYNMPTTYHTYDVNFQYNRQCIQQHRNYLRNGVASPSMYQSQCYPTANINFDLPGNKKVLRADQLYRGYLSLELPESEVNLKIGMFMATMTYGKTTMSQATSLRFRPAMLRYATMVTFWPLFLFDFMETKQTIDIPLFEKIRFEKPSRKDITTCAQKHDGSSWACSHRTAKIEIDYPDIQIYSAHLHLTATFSGLQHFFFQWPVFSFLVGTAIFFVPVLASVLVLFYLILCKPFWMTRPIRGDAQEQTEQSSRRRRRNRRRDPPPREVPVEAIEPREEDEDAENDSPAPSTASSSIEMIGHPSVENTSEAATEPESNHLPNDDDDGEGTSSGKQDAESETSLRKRKL